MASKTLWDVCSIIIRLAISALVFFASFRIGKYHKDPEIICPTSTASASIVIDPALPCLQDTSSHVSYQHSTSTQKIEPSCSHTVSNPNSWLYIHKNDISQIKNNSVLSQVFSNFHHPSTPVKSEFILKQLENYQSIQDISNLKKVLRGFPQQTAVQLSLNSPFSDCSQVILSRVGSSYKMPNKCLAVARVNEESASPFHHSHRSGVQAKMLDQYVTDWGTSKEYQDEQVLLPLLLHSLDGVINEFRTLMGDPLVPGAGGNGRRSVIVMVANEGVMDLLLNFVCSCKSANISLSNLVVFLGQPEYGPLVHSIGAKSFYSPALGTIPRKAADNYGDIVFARLMWLKATSVYIACKAGYNVLFQDADLVWLRDPIPSLSATVDDIAFMDDGARTTRFTPFFANSGFYYQTHSSKTVYLMEKMLKSAVEISATHSHQATLTRHLTELYSNFHLSITILPTLLYPSGAQWHNDKKFIAKLIKYELLPEVPTAEPYVFHMSWTSSRTDKLTYFKALGFWYLPEHAEKATTGASRGSEGVCSVGAKMLGAARAGVDLRLACCQMGGYMSARPT